MQSRPRVSLWRRRRFCAIPSGGFTCPQVCGGGSGCFDWSLCLSWEFPEGKEQGLARQPHPDKGELPRGNLPVPSCAPHVLFTLGRGRFLSARPQGLGWGEHSLASVPSLLSVSRALESEKDYKKIKSGLSLQPTRLLQVFQLPAQTPLSPLSPHDKGTEWAEAVASVQRGCGKKRTINRAQRTGNHL